MLGPAPRAVFPWRNFPSRDSGISFYLSLANNDIQTLEPYKRRLFVLPVRRNLRHKTDFSRYYKLCKFSKGALISDNFSL